MFNSIVNFFKSKSNNAARRELEAKIQEQALKVEFQAVPDAEKISEWATETGFGSRFDSINNLNNPHFEHIQKLRGYLQAGH